MAIVRGYSDRKSRLLEKLWVYAKSHVWGKGKVQDQSEDQFSFRRLNEQSQESWGSRLGIKKSTEATALEAS